MLRAGQILNVFTEFEIQSMIDVLAKLENQLNTGKERNYTNGFQSNSLIYPFIKKKILNKLETILGENINLTVGMLLKENKPWTIHTDYVKSDSNPDLAILIPLNINPIKTHTVIFNESCTNSFDEFKINNKKLDNNSLKIHDTLMSQEIIENLEYVSLHAAYEWIPNSIIYWDRKLLHSSDNFLKNGIAEKQALVLFTNLDK